MTEVLAKIKKLALAVAMSAAMSIAVAVVMAVAMRRANLAQVKNKKAKKQKWERGTTISLFVNENSVSSLTLSLCVLKMEKQNGKTNFFFFFWVQHWTTRKFTKKKSSRGKESRSKGTARSTERSTGR